MRFNVTASIFSGFLAVLLMVPIAGAMTVTLDSVGNAGWSAESLEQPYLKILDGTTTVWSSESSTPSWSGFSDLVADLADGWIGFEGTGTPLGGTYAIQAGGDVFFPSTPIYQTIHLSAGHYEVSLDSNSEAYNIVGYSDQNYSGGDWWNAYVQMWTSDGQSHAFGDGNTIYGSEFDALDAYNTRIRPLSLSLSDEADLFLYINDINSLDNEGSVTLNIQPVPVPAAWLLFGSGIAALVGGRRFRKGGTG